MQKKIAHIVARPYATMYGTIEVPPGIENVDDFVDKNFDLIEFEGEPELDFKGTDFDISDIEWEEV